MFCTLPLVLIGIVPVGMGIFYRIYFVVKMTALWKEKIVIDPPLAESLLHFINNREMHKRDK
jgi:hypothetical protein